MAIYRALIQSNLEPFISMIDGSRSNGPYFAFCARPGVQVQLAFIKFISRTAVQLVGIG